MAGRKPKPSHLKLLAGNPGKRAINRKEPKPKRGVPKKPEHLSDIAAAAWDRIGPELKTMGVLTVADGPALEMMCEAYAQYRTALDSIDRHGPTYETEGQSGVMIRARPEVAMASDAHRRFVRMLAEFGLTPSSRSRVSASGEEAEDPMDRLLG